MIPTQHEYNTIRFVVGNRETGEFFQEPGSPQYPVGPFATARVFQERRDAENTLRWTPWTFAEVIPVEVAS